MALYYFDTSALAKRYIAELGSRWIAALVVSEGVAVSELMIVEMASALARRTREGTITPAGADATFRSFMTEMVHFTVLGVSRELFRQSATLLLTGMPSMRVRTLDAIHLASALAAFERAQRRGEAVGAFVSADRVLIEAARSLGLTAVDPEDYP